MIATAKNADGVLRTRRCLSCGSKFSTAESIWLPEGSAPAAVEEPQDPGDLAPERWPWCQHYGRCLVEAARVDKAFCCSGCGRYEPGGQMSHEDALKDASACGHLLWAVFHEG